MKLLSVIPGYCFSPVEILDGVEDCQSLHGLAVGMN